MKSIHQVNNIKDLF